MVPTGIQNLLLLIDVDILSNFSKILDKNMKFNNKDERERHSEINTCITFKQSHNSTNPSI